PERGLPIPDRRGVRHHRHPLERAAVLRAGQDQEATSDEEQRRGRPVSRRLSSNSSPTSAAKSVRCAIYTRKSTEEGLEQEFNSLDAQRESAEAYIASQKNEGWACLPDRYDDGGFSGGTTERPAL